MSPGGRSLRRTRIPLRQAGLLAAWLLLPAACSGASFLRGDVDQDGTIGLTDPIDILQSLFLGAGELACADSGDADDSGTLDLTDPIHLLTFLFLGGMAPPAPYPSCGLDPSDDALSCKSYRGVVACPDDPGDGCGNVVGRAAEIGCGRVFAWGDEHITYEENWPEVEPFWTNAVLWLTETTCGDRARTRAWVSGLSGRPHLYAFLQSQGLTVMENGSLGEVDLFLGWPEQLPPDGVHRWVEQGGALMTLVGGYPDGRQDMCDLVNQRLAGLGLQYDCLHRQPGGPVTEFSDHPLGAGLSPENAPFLNGTFIVEAPGAKSEVVARIGDCHPKEAPDCRYPIHYNGPAPGDTLNVETDCAGPEYWGVNLPSGEVELNVIGVYGPGGEMRVRVERESRMVLVLSSREPAMWFVELGAGARVEQVILNGYSAQEGDVPGGIPVENHDADLNGDYLGAGYGYDCGGGDTLVMIPRLEALTGLTLRSFRGCYRATQFTIH